MYLEPPDGGTPDKEQGVVALDAPGRATGDVISGANGQDSAVMGLFRPVAVVRPVCNMIIVEGGPHLIGDVLNEGRVDELFLTLSPQVAGRSRSSERWGIVAERIFAPDNPLWGSLVSVKRESSHLFLRYAFDRRGLQRFQRRTVQSNVIDRALFGEE